MDTKVKKDKLLVILRENQRKHREVFEASLSGYIKRALELVRETERALTEGRTPELRLLLSRPQDHTRDYDRVITMLELDVRDEFVLTEAEAAKYLMDDWQWKRDWLKMSSRYAGAATVANYGNVEEDEDL